MKCFAYLAAVSVLVGATSTARATIIANTVTEFSTAAQGTNGFQYGYYPTDSTTGTFSTAGMTVSGASWVGTGSFNTPIIGDKFMHPSNSSTQYTAVRRYTVGSAGEETVDTSAPITISGKFWDSQGGGGAQGFVTVNGVQQFAVNIPEGSTETSGFAPFSLTLTVPNGTTVDFGMRPINGDFSSDGSAMSATIDATVVPEPASLGLLCLSALALVRRRSR